MVGSFSYPCLTSMARVPAGRHSPFVDFVAVNPPVGFPAILAMYGMGLNVEPPMPFVFSQARLTAGLTFGVARKALRCPFTVVWVMGYPFRTVERIDQPRTSRVRSFGL